MSNHSVQYERIRYALGEKWLLILQKKAYGWHYWRDTNDEQKEIEWNSDLSGHTTTKITHRVEFRRVSNYSNNFFFVIAEFFSNIFGLIRELFIIIALPALIISIILAVINQTACFNYQMSELCYKFAEGIAIGYGVCIVITLINAGFGLLWRVVFKIDEKAKKIFGDDLRAACRMVTDD